MRLLLNLALFTLVSCGGRLVDSSTSSEQSSTEAEAPQTSFEDGEWGTWQLFSLDQPDGRRRYDPPFIELDLHPNGKAYLWTCREGTPDGQRCPYPFRVGCLFGTIEPSGTNWHVRFADGQGAIAEEPSGDITIEGEGVIPGAITAASAPQAETGAFLDEQALP